MIGEDGNIEDWYREELSNFEANPDNGWDSLSDELDASDIAGGEVKEENIEDWYRKEMERYEEKPDAVVWNKLSDKLDVSNVWERLLVSLNHYDKVMWWKSTAFKSAAVLLLLFGSYVTYLNYFDVEPSGNDSLARVENENFATEKADKTEISNKNNSIVENKKGDIFTSKEVSNLNRERISDDLPTDQNPLNNDELLASANDGMDKSLLSYVANKNANLENESVVNGKVVEKDMELADPRIKTLESKEFLVKKDRNKIIFNSKRFSSHFVFGMYARRIYFGVNAGFKKQYVISSLKDNSHLADFNKNELLDFGTSFGGTVGLIVSDKFNLESSVNLMSSVGYKTEYSNAEGTNFTEELDLNYTQVSLLAKKMNNKTTFDNKKYSTNFIGGVYVGVLNSAKMSSLDNAMENFSKIDYGIVLGIEQDRYLTKELVITPGVRYHQGIQNTASGISPFSSSRNFSLEFNLGLKFIFLKKG